MHLYRILQNFVSTQLPDIFRKSQSVNQQIQVRCLLRYVIEPSDSWGAGDGRASKVDGKEQAPVGLGKVTYYYMTHVESIVIKGT